MGNVSDLVGNIGELINLLVPIVFTLALLFFFWGLARFILSSGEEKEKSKGIMIWGIVALFIMSSVWGITAYIGSALGVGENVAGPNTSNLLPKSSNSSSGFVNQSGSSNNMTSSVVLPKYDPSTANTSEVYHNNASDVQVTSPQLLEEMSGSTR